MVSETKQLTDEEVKEVVAKAIEVLKKDPVFKMLTKIVQEETDGRDI